MLAALRADLRAARERDPAARSTVELVLCYPGVHAVWAHRVSHWLWRHGRTLTARLCSAFTRGSPASRSTRPRSSAPACSSTTRSAW